MTSNPVGGALPVVGVAAGVELFSAKRYLQRETCAARRFIPLIVFGDLLIDGLEWNPALVAGVRTTFLSAEPNETTANYATMDQLVAESARLSGNREAELHDR